MVDAAPAGAAGDQPDDRAAFDAIVAANELHDLDRNSPPESRPKPAATLGAAGEASLAAQQRLSTTAPPVPELPPLPPVPARPQYPLHKVERLGFAMTTAVAAIGQVLFFREWFGGGVAATVAAIAVAACFEVTMIGAGDGALRHRVHQQRGWPLMLAISGFVAIGATVLQLLHWMPISVGIAITFALASLVGWIVHTATGWITGSGYLDAKHTHDAEVERRNRKSEARADAAYARQLAEHETTRQAAARAVAEADPGTGAPAAGTARASKSKTGQHSRPQLDRDTAIGLIRRHLPADTTSAAARALLTEQGYRVDRDDRTLRRWIADARQ